MSPVRNLRPVQGSTSTTPGPAAESHYWRTAGHRGSRYFVGATSNAGLQEMHLGPDGLFYKVVVCLCAARF